MIEKISECDVILSSSLHGLVVADALNIPNEWLNFRDLHSSSAFKFYDYAAGIGRALPKPITKIDFSKLENLAEISEARPRDYWRNIDKINESLMESLQSTLRER